MRTLVAVSAALNCSTIAAGRKAAQPAPAAMTEARSAARCAARRTRRSVLASFAAVVMVPTIPDVHDAFAVACRRTIYRGDSLAGKHVGDGDQEPRAVSRSLRLSAWPRAVSRSLWLSAVSQAESC